MTLEATEETPAGVGAVSIVRVRGDSALAHVSVFLGRGDLTLGAPRLARLRVRGEDLDEALICALSEQEVEIHLHGSPLLVRALLAALAPLADSSAARIDASSPARARALLASAPCESGARILLDQSECAWREFLGNLANTPEPRTELELVRERSRVARSAIQPALVVLAGPVNAGKSTLFNTLVGERRAITSSLPGTTRDLVRARVLLGRYAVDLVDTAGERDLDALTPVLPVERAGIARARGARARADVVFWLCDAARAAQPAPPGALGVFTHSDSVSNAPQPAISAITDPMGARATVARLFVEHAALPDDPWIPGAACAFDAQSRRELDELCAAETPEELRARALALAAEDSARVAGDTPRPYGLSGRS